MKVKKIIPVVLCVILLLCAAGLVVTKLLPSEPQLETPATSEQTESVVTQGETLATQTEDPLHEHSFDKLQYTKKATCEQIGYKRYVCACGVTQMKDIQDPLGHDWDKGVKKEATCTEEGGKLYTCRSCGQTELRDPVEAKTHSFGVWEMDPEDPRQQLRICRVCGQAQYRDDNTPTQTPTEQPTQVPTEQPTQAPTEAPTQQPTEELRQPIELLDSHSVIVTDIKNGRIIVTDLDKAEPFAAKNLIWEWIPSKAQGWSYITQSTLKDAISGVKYRWSEYFQTNVVLFTCARGTAGMIEYPSGKCLWKAKVGNSPHSIELLPNGDIVVAASGGGEWDAGRLTYFELTGGSYVATTEHMLYSAHGVTWDPENEVLWASGFRVVEAYRLTTDAQGRATLSKVAGKGAAIADGSGHDLMQDYADSDILWVTTNRSVLQFSKSRNAFLGEFPNSAALRNVTGVKGIGGFSDGVTAFASYGDGVGGDHPAVLRIVYPREDGSFETVLHNDTGSG